MDGEVLVGIDRHFKLYSPESTTSWDTNEHYTTRVFWYNHISDQGKDPMIVTFLNGYRDYKAELYRTRRAYLMNIDPTRLGDSN